MLRYLRPLTEPFTDKYRQYLPLPTSTPRGSVSAQGSNGTSSPPDSPTSPTSGTNPFKALSKKTGIRRRTLSWHVKLFLVLVAFAFTLHTTVRKLFFPPTGSTEEARTEALSLLSKQLSTNYNPQAPFSTSSAESKIAANSTHLLFRDPSPAITSREILPIRAYDSLSDACIDEWVVHHIWGPVCHGTDLSQGLKFDAVWAWVNGSDPAQILARHQFRPSSPINVDAAHRYADHNELLYSMRSAWRSWGDAIGKMHIMASAYPLPNQTVAELGVAKEGETIWSGQVPYWLNASALSDKDSKIALHHDASYFQPMQHISSAVDARDWRAKTLPSFNSLAVESQLYNLPSASSDSLVYLNDDFFTLTPNTVSDLTSPLFGTVIKSDTRIISWYLPSEHPFQRLWNPAGEEVGIKRAGWILGQRFPLRSLPYITHHPRSLSLPLLREAAAMFPKSFGDTTLARFRAQKEVPESVQAFFLASWFIVERHREALLWSWIVAKWGGADGSMSGEKKRAMWAELASSSSSSGQNTMQVPRPVRASRDNDKQAFEASGVPSPRNTEYSFSSQDGYALSYVDWSWPWERTRNGYPDLSSKDAAGRSHPRSWTDSSKIVCKLSFSKCFAPAKADESVDGLFKRLAFASPECGDCIIAALLNQSGEKGIVAFLPSASSETMIRVDRDTARDQKGSRAHLPVTSQWRETDFSLASVLPSSSSATGDDGEQVSLRTFATRLIQRYQYVLGSTPSTFYKVEYASRLPGQLKAVDDTLETDKPTTYVCLNDDIKEDADATTKLNNIMNTWFAKHWSQRLPGELFE